MKRKALTLLLAPLLMFLLFTVPDVVRADEPLNQEIILQGEIESTEVDFSAVFNPNGGDISPVTDITITFPVPVKIAEPYIFTIRYNMAYKLTIDDINTSKIHLSCAPATNYRDLFGDINIPWPISSTFAVDPDSLSKAVIPADNTLDWGKIPFKKPSFRVTGSLPLELIATYPNNGDKVEVLPMGSSGMSSSVFKPQDGNLPIAFLFNQPVKIDTDDFKVSSTNPNSSGWSGNFDKLYSPYDISGYSYVVSPYAIFNQGVYGPNLVDVNTTINIDIGSLETLTGSKNTENYTITYVVNDGTDKITIGEIKDNPPWPPIQTNPTGELIKKWEIKPIPFILENRTPPIKHGDFLVYGGKALTVIDAKTGNIVWSAYSHDGNSRIIPKVAQSGEIYILNHEKTQRKISGIDFDKWITYLESYNLDGSMRFRVQIPGFRDFENDATMVVADNGDIVILAEDCYISLFLEGQTTLYRFNSEGSITGASVLYPTNSGITFNATPDKVWWADDTTVVVTNDGQYKFIALKSGG